jgi:hypothetical protein
MLISERILMDMEYDLLRMQVFLFHEYACLAAAAELVQQQRGHAPAAGILEKRADAAGVDVRHGCAY